MSNEDSSLSLSDKSGGVPGGGPGGFRPTGSILGGKPGALPNKKSVFGFRKQLRKTYNIQRKSVSGQVSLYKHVTDVAKRIKMDFVWKMKKTYTHTSATVKAPQDAAVLVSPHITERSHSGQDTSRTATPKKEE